MFTMFIGEHCEHLEQVSMKDAVVPFTVFDTKSLK